MVHLDVLNPAHKLRLISKLLFKGSKRILKQANTPTSATYMEQQSPRPPKVNILDLIKTNLPVPQGGLTRDPAYYKDESEGGFCVFRVEHTLFKVHKCYFLREPSAFGDMFSLPNIPGNREGLSDDMPVALSDTAEKFRDLLWALYAIPSQLYPASEADSQPIERLLNIAELTNKYCIASYEAWALDQILRLAQCPMGFVRQGTPDACARALNIAVLCNHQKLLDTITLRLIPRILWSDMDITAVLKVAEIRGLRKIQGVVHYKELVNLENASDPPLVFPPALNAEKRRYLSAARHSLNNLWECIESLPPTFTEHGCISHADCLTTWTELWKNAASANQTLRNRPVDVLGRLKSMMILLKKSTIHSDSMTLSCSLSALESITTMREDIIAGLMDHFQVY